MDETTNLVVSFRPGEVKLAFGESYEIVIDAEQAQQVGWSIQMAGIHAADAAYVAGVAEEGAGDDEEDAE